MTRKLPRKKKKKLKKICQKRIDTLEAHSTQDLSSLLHARCDGATFDKNNKVERLTFCN